MGVIYLNEEAYGGGGGGGNSISYGYTAPSASGSDGDLYYLLNSNDKKIALFMYMTNEWKVIDGNVDVYEVELFKSRLNSTQSDTYTADSTCTVLCINQTLNGQASSYSNTATITTTGTIVDTDEYSSQYGNNERNQITRVSLINLEEGDTVTFNNSNGNFTTQLHIVLKLGIFTYADQVTRKVMHATPDNYYTTSQSYTTDGDEIYFALGFQCRGTGGGTQYATIAASGEADTRELLRAGSNHSVSVSIGNHPNTFTFSWGNQNDYATKGYAVYKIYGGAS